MSETTQSQHTPGPWVLVENSWDVSTVYAPGGETIAQCPISGLADEETQDYYEAIMQANARLIATAPDLLAACQNYMSVIDTPFETSDDDMRKAYDMMRLAIAKATSK